MTNSTSEREQRLKGDKAIHEIISEWCGEGTIGVMRQKIVEYIASIRQEERRAAFKDAIRIAEAAQPAVKQVYTAAQKEAEDETREEIVKALAAAANETREDGDDG